MGSSIPTINIDERVWRSIPKLLSVENSQDKGDDCDQERDGFVGDASLA